MAKFTPYGVTTLPSGLGIDVNGIYFLKEGANNYFSIHIRKADNSGWVALAEFPVQKVNGMLGDVTLDLNLSSTGILSLSGSTVTLNLDSRYTRNSDNIPFSRISDRPNTLTGYGITDAALDNKVVHNYGDENITGVKSFSISPKVPLVPTTDSEVTSKKYVDDIKNAIGEHLSTLESVVAAGVRVAEPIDCSTNPNYPTAEKGDRWRVTVAGRIGGASGVLVGINDLIECVNDTTSGDHSTVGSKFIILQSNIDSATETTEGYIRKATNAEGLAGSSNVGAMTPLHVNSKINATSIKYSEAQSLTEAQKLQARNNISAASQLDVAWGQKDW